MIIRLTAIAFAIASVALTAPAGADEMRVKSWPDGVPCSALVHKSDGSWALADIVVGPDGSRHYPSPDRESQDNRYFAQKCRR